MYIKDDIKFKKMTTDNPVIVQVTYQIVDKNEAKAVIHITKTRNPFVFHSPHGQF